MLDEPGRDSSGSSGQKSQSLTPWPLRLSVRLSAPELSGLSPLPPAPAPQPPPQSAGPGRSPWAGRGQAGGPETGAVSTAATPLPAHPQGCRLAEGASGECMTRSRTPQLCSSSGAPLPLPLCPHGRSLGPHTSRPGLRLLICAVGAGRAVGSPPTGAPVLTPAGTHGRPVSTQASAGRRNRNPHETEREGGGGGEEKRGVTSVPNTPTAVPPSAPGPRREISAPSPSAGDPSPACHSLAWFILRPPNMHYPPYDCLPASCRDTRTPVPHLCSQIPPVALAPSGTRVLAEGLRGLLST